MGNGLQTFMRMANLYGPQQMSATPPAPEELPSRYLIGQDPYGYDENIDVGVEEPPENATLAAFKQNVLNPPPRPHMTYPDSTLNGLKAALQVAAEPSPLEKNRVYVNGKPYQKQRVYTDPKTGEKKYITDVHEPSFSSQVMRAMPAAVSAGVDLANQPYKDAMADWDLKNKGLASAATAEANMALARQRQANAAAIPERLNQGQQKIDISRMTAEEKARVSKLNTLTDAQKIQLLQEGRISLAELNAAAALEREQVRGEYGMERQGLAGRQRLEQIDERGRIEAGHIAQRGTVAERVARVRAEEARKTKAAIGWTNPNAGIAGSYPSQQRIAIQQRASQIVNQHPEWEEFIDIDEEGFPTIEPPSRFGLDENTYNQIYKSIYGIDRSQAIGSPAGVTPPATAKPPARPAPKGGTPQAGGNIEMITPDGKSTRMVPANQVQTAIQQGYKRK